MEQQTRAFAFLLGEAERCYARHTYRQSESLQDQKLSKKQPRQEQKKRAKATCPCPQRTLGTLPTPPLQSRLHLPSGPVYELSSPVPTERCWEEAHIRLVSYSQSALPSQRPEEAVHGPQLKKKPAPSSEYSRCALPFL